jgi:hypothetical protein
LTLRQTQQDHHGQHQQRHHGNPEDCAPTEIFGHEAGGGPRQQDPQQQSAHHRADRLTTPGGRREFGGERHGLLRDGGEHADREAGADQYHESRCGGGDHQRDAQAGDLQQDQQTPVEAVAERRKQQHAGRVAELGGGRHHADPRRAMRKRLAQAVEQRLVVIDIRDGDAGDDGKQKQQATQRAFSGGG